MQIGCAFIICIALVGAISSYFKSLPKELTQSEKENLSVPEIKWPEKPELPSFNSKVAITAQFNDPNDTKPVIIGYTNLPDGTDLMVDLDRKNIKYSDGFKTTVNSGKFQTQRFTGAGGVLPPGEYSMDISTTGSPLQPVAVQNIIGTRGENLKGKWTIKYAGYRAVRYTAVLHLGNGESKTGDAEFIQRQKQQDLELIKKADEKIPDAKLMCQEFVKRQLNDPESAQFDDVDTYFAKYSNWNYNVQVHVRARNGFNAMRPAIFDCKITPGSDGKWILLGIKQIEF